MSLVLKDDNTTGSFLLCHLFYMFSVIMISDIRCTGVHLYTIVICTDGIIIGMCPCLLLVPICVVYHRLGIFLY